MLILDIGCGPGSITSGLPGRVIGLDVDPVAIDGVPVVGAEGSCLPFPDSTFDAIFMNAVLQHVADAHAVLREVRRVACPSAVIGIGDTDWGTRVMHPHNPWIARGQEIQELARTTGNVRVGRELRGLLESVGLDGVHIDVEGRVLASEPEIGQMAAFEGSWFEAPEAVAFVAGLGLSNADEMAKIAEAWKAWSHDPSALVADAWFTALGWAPQRDH
jgi:SAM-dependent methyltransferase